LLEFFPDGLTTAEVALLLADGPDPAPDHAFAELLLAEIVEAGAATREPLGGSALWTPRRRVTAGVGPDATRAHI
jgi:hypothetical protein